MMQSWNWALYVALRPLWRAVAGGRPRGRPKAAAWLTFDAKRAAPCDRGALIPWTRFASAC